MKLDELDREILDEIQRTFPLVEKPYHELATRFGIEPGQMMDRLRRLKAGGILRQLSAIFDTRKLGYTSSLVAMDIEPDELERVAARVSEHPGVSHNYERRSEFNLWFTIAVPPGASIEAELDEFSILPGVRRVRMLPTLRLFKIGVKLEMVEGKKRAVSPTESGAEAAAPEFSPTELDKEFVRHLQRDLEVTDEPFRTHAEALGMSTEQIFEKLRRYQEMGVLRRFAAILRHRDAGFTANGMIVWKVPEERVEEVGSKLGSFPQVSHCYQRPTYPDWPYNIFSMIHCKTVSEAREVASQIEAHVGVPEYDILFSSREFKKSRVEYFV